MSQVVVPLATRSSFFSTDEYHFPKPLVEVGGTPMIQLVVENLRSAIPAAEFIFLVRQDDIDLHSLDNVLKLVAGDDAVVIGLKRETKGALCTAMLAVDALDMSRPLIICNGDQIISGNFAGNIEKLAKSGADAGVFTFPSVHPRWSYIKPGIDGLVEEAAEKRVISRHAIAGLYWFEKAKIFFDAAKRTILNKSSVDGIYYVAPALNEVILDGGEVRHIAIPESHYHSFYAPVKIAEYENKNILKHLPGSMAGTLSDTVVVIPAAGEGSRFRQAGYAKPKPFIDVAGQPMIHRVLKNVLPTGAKGHLLMRHDHVEAAGDTLQQLRDQGVAVQLVDRLTEGTACTVLLAREAYDSDAPMLVANSDQLVDFSVDDFVQDCLDRELDGSILVFRDNFRDPKWSFARVDAQGLVVEVQEKKPISDLATVGIYLFRRGSDYVRAAADMIARNERVNNEFYTCPVYNSMIASGLKIGVFEVDASAMHGLGTPADLEAYLAVRRAA